MLAYLEFVADRLDLLRDIQFNTWVEDASYDDSGQRWTITTHTGERFTARFMICAVGALFVAHKPNYHDNWACGQQTEHPQRRS